MYRKYYVNGGNLHEIAEGRLLNLNDGAPAKVLLPFLCTAPLQYVPKILFTPAAIDGLATNKTKNVLHNETAGHFKPYWRWPN